MSREEKVNGTVTRATVLNHIHREQENGNIRAVGTAPPESRGRPEVIYQVTARGRKALSRQ